MSEQKAATIPEDLKPLCNRLARQEPITAAEAWPLIGRIAALEAEVARLSAPVTNAELTPHCLGKKYLLTEVFDRVLAARANQQTGGAA